MPHSRKGEREVCQMAKVKKYLVLDCETATLPKVYEIAKTESERQKAAIAKPLIYDIGWKVVDRNGKVYDRQHYLVTETFCSPSIFNTAYYREKRPLYIEKLNRGEISLKPWSEITALLEESMQNIFAVGAYNSMFDFKKAIPFTELYMQKMLSADFSAWLDSQYNIVKDIVDGEKYESNKVFELDVFRFKGREYPLFDLWGLACDKLYNNKNYKHMCIENNFVTASRKFFKTSAEVGYRFITNNLTFEESHTAIEDADIECEILKKIFATKKKNCFYIGIVYFPFRILGKVEEFTGKIFED